ncbi:hypothetical protein GDO81_027275 [Engystomops pustulosus]|uniref:Calpain catalytic domain-containing protein n=1 Tax=Engystomops pustulosus TaxID=76066 RepID=A0AAV6ZEE4_ENGPU|nr:hypothetical protein GDO81_027275 [Engystomops pustulosus]
MSLVKSDMCKGSYVRPKMGTVEQPRKFANQDYEMLREWHVKKKVLFTDETFPANMNSIGSRLKKEFNTHHIEWKRPREICEDPHFIVDGVSLFDILQSKLGDCWLLSAIASLTLKPGLLEKIMPVNQGYSRYYAGIFHFRLWHLGEWLDIVIDDKLPFLDGKYFSVRPSCNNEFWPCLLEKAYAKFLGSYQNLHWGDPSEAFINLTGGLTMTFDLQSPEAHTYWNMINLAGPETLMACISGKQDPTRTNQSTRTRTHAGNQRSGDLNNGHLEELDNGNESEGIQNGQDLFISNRRRGTMDNVYPEELEHDYAPEHMYTFNITENGQDIYSGNRRTSVLSDKLPENVLNKCGIVERHAYSITDHAEIPFRNGTVQLIRIWNPWGFGEWRGRWNDRCPQWKELREEDRLRLQRISDDGEFWLGLPGDVLAGFHHSL